MEKVKCYKFLCNLQALIWESVRETKFFEFEYFSFLFSFVEMFQCSFNFESSVNFFHQNSRLNFLSVAQLGRILVVVFRLILLLFLGKLLASLKYLSAIKGRVTKPFGRLFFLPLQFGPRIRAEVPDSSSWQIVEGSFWVPYCLRLLLLFPLWSNVVPHEAGLIFS